jgi:hypothetical protein
MQRRQPCPALESTCVETPRSTFQRIAIAVRAGASKRARASVSVRTTAMLNSAIQHALRSYAAVLCCKTALPKAALHACLASPEPIPCCTATPRHPQPDPSPRLQPHPLANIGIALHGAGSPGRCSRRPPAPRPSHHRSRRPSGISPPRHAHRPPFRASRVSTSGARGGVVRSGVGSCSAAPAGPSGPICSRAASSGRSCRTTDGTPAPPAAAPRGVASASAVGAKLGRSNTMGARSRRRGDLAPGAPSTDLAPGAPSTWGPRPRGDLAPGAPSTRPSPSSEPAPRPWPRPGGGDDGLSEAGDAAAADCCSGTGATAPAAGCSGSASATADAGAERGTSRVEPPGGASTRASSRARGAAVPL